MEDRHKEILQQNRKSLVDDIDVPEIINHLIQSNVLTSTLKDDIMSKPTRQGQVVALLDILPRRGPRAFQEFCNALQEKYDWLAEKLESPTTSKTTDGTSGLNPTFLCQRCFHFYDDNQHQPKLLPCNHGYCLDCIIQLAGRNSFYQCPMCHKTWDLPQGGASLLPINEFVHQSQAHVRQHTDEGELPTVSEIICVNLHPVPNIPEDIQITLSGSQEHLKLAVTNPDGTTIYIPMQKIRGNIYKAKCKAKIRGLHHVRVIVTNDNIVLSGAKFQFTVGSNNPVWRSGSRGPGPGQFNNPRDVALDRDGNIYVADSVNFRIVKVSLLGKYISHFELANPEENKENTVTGIAINNREQEIVCIKGYNDDERYPWGHTIQIYNMQGELKYEYVNTDMKKARHVTVNSRGQIIASDWTVNVIFIGSRQGEHIQWERVETEGLGPGELRGLEGITIGPDDDIVVCDGSNKRVQVLHSNGLYKNNVVANGEELGKFLFPMGVAVDEDHNILVSDYLKNVIQVFSYDGSFLSCIDSEGDKLNHPHGLAVTGDGHVIVADQYNHCIKKYRYK